MELNWAATTVEIDLSWILAIISVLASVIASLAGILWAQMNARLKVQTERLENQDRHIAQQDEIIRELQVEVSRLGKGCGMVECWWNRGNQKKNHAEKG